MQALVAAFGPFIAWIRFAVHGRCRTCRQTDGLEIPGSLCRCKSFSPFDLPATISKRENQQLGNRIMNRILAGACLAAWSMTMAGGPVAAQTSKGTVIATGLDGPRGLKFGPDGNLYIAEAGSGGTTSTVGTCAQVPGPVGPYTGGSTARISMIAPDGTRSIVIDHLPSTQDALGGHSGRCGHRVRGW